LENFFLQNSGKEGIKKVAAVLF